MSDERCTEEQWERRGADRRRRKRRMREKLAKLRNKQTTARRIRRTVDGIVGTLEGNDD